VLVFDNSGRGNLEGDRKFINAIRFADTPAFDPIDRRRHLFGITLGSPRIDPSDQNVLFRLAQRSGVRELAVTGIRKPPGHRAF
jgi:hypothetical protein